VNGSKDIKQEGHNNGRKYRKKTRWHDKDPIILSPQKGKGKEKEGRIKKNERTEETEGQGRKCNVAEFG